jgi:hypothetical protein
MTIDAAPAAAHPADLDAAFRYARRGGVTLRYAPSVDALTILYGQDAQDTEVHTVELDEARCMDYSDDGRILSVEVLGASREVYLYGIPRAADVAAALAELGLPARSAEAAESA